MIPLTVLRLARGFPVVALTGPRQSGKTALARAAPDLWIIRCGDRFFECEGGRVFSWRALRESQAWCRQFRTAVAAAPDSVCRECRFAGRQAPFPETSSRHLGGSRPSS